MSTPPPPRRAEVRAGGAGRPGRHRADDRPSERWDAGGEPLLLGDRFVLEQHTGALMTGTDRQLQRPVAVLSLGELPHAMPAAHVLERVHSAHMVFGPGIAELLEGVLHEDRLLLVFAPARTTLADLREHGPLQEEETAEVILSVADAVAALRQAGLSWAPLDPEHLAVDEEGRVRVLPLPPLLKPGAPGGRHRRAAGADELVSLRELAQQLLGEAAASPPPTGLHLLLDGSPLSGLDELRDILRQQPPGAAAPEPDSSQEPVPGAGGAQADQSGGSLDTPGSAAAHIRRGADGWVMTVLIALIAAGAVLLVGLIVTA